MVKLLLNDGHLLADDETPIRVRKTYPRGFYQETKDVLTPPIDIRRDDYIVIQAPFTLRVIGVEQC